MNTRKKSVDSHVAAGDYFGTLATILNLIAEDEEKAGRGKNAKLLKDLVEDLVYLQHHYKIGSSGTSSK